jgi:predicted nucleic acid-binding protein
MKTTVDIPDQELADALRFTRAKTKREAIVTALIEFNRRHRMAELVKYSASSDSFMTVNELRKLRQKR